MQYFDVIAPPPEVLISAKILGLDVCADTLVGDEMLKGISGGQKKRLTTGLLTSISFRLTDILIRVLMMPTRYFR